MSNFFSNLNDLRGKIFANWCEYFLSYALTFQKVIDLLAVTPFYIWLVVWIAMDEKWKSIEVFGNLLRILRVLRLFKTRALSNPYVMLLVGAVVRKIICFLYFFRVVLSSKFTRMGAWWSIIRNKNKILIYSKFKGA